MSVVAAALSSIAALALGAARDPPPGRTWKPILTTTVEVSREEDVAGAASLDTVGFADPRRGIAVGHHGVVRYTRDGGRTWSRPKFPATKADLDGLEITQEGAAWTAGGCQLRRSTDGGETWEELPSHGPPFAVGHCLSFVDAEHGWYANGARSSVASPLAATRDGGRSWTPVPLPENARDRIMAVHLLSAAEGFVLLADATVLRTRDGGAHWTSLRLPVRGRELIGEPAGPAVEALRFTDPRRGVVVLYAERPRGFVALETFDAGESWREIAWEGPRPTIGNVFLSRDATLLTIRDLGTPAVVVYRLE